MCCLSSVLPAQEIEERQSPKVSVAGPAGLRTHLPGEWGILQLTLENLLDTPVELLAATFFDEQKTLQFGRRATVPARGRIRTSHPILFPKNAADSTKFNFHTLLVREHQGKEVVLRTGTGQLQLDGSLERNRERPIAGIISQPSVSSAGEIDWLFEFTRAARPRDYALRRFVPLNDQPVPPLPEGLQAVDHLIVADEQLTRDQAGMAAIRRWLYDGGRLWVMLDRVDAGALELLLGDEFHGEVLDRVGLTNVAFETGPSGIATGHSSRDFDDPVAFVRLLLPEADLWDVAYSVDGWPAAFWKTCGDGRLLVTTLGPQAWLREPTAAEKAADKVEGSFRPAEPLANLATVYFEPRPVPLMATTSLEPQVDEYIGYSIPPRWLIAGLLIGFSGLLGGIGVWLWARGRLEWLGIVGPVLAIVVGAALVVIGRQQRDAAPPAVASLQFVQVLPGTDDVRVEGLAGVFSPEPGTATFAATSGGRLMPDMSGQEGQTRRMIWTDREAWHWENVPQPAGLRVAPFTGSAAAESRTAVRATFDSQGVTGRLVSRDGADLSDALLVTRDGRISLEPGREGDGAFVARSNKVLGPKQFVAAELLTDEQNRRRALLERLLANPRRLDYPEAPLLLYWTKPWDAGFRFGDGYQHLGAALVAAPVQFERPPAGTEILVPGPLLPFRGATGPDGAPPSGLYNHRKREWAPKSSPSSTWLRFQIPHVLLPVELQSARATVFVNGPVGKLEIAGQNNRQPVAIRSWRDPVGALALDITEMELLPVADDGGVFLRVSGGDPDRPELTQTQDAAAVKAHYWQIESMTLEMKLKTLAPTGAAVEPAPGG